MQLEISSQLTFEKLIETVIFKVRAGTAITPIYLIMDRASSYLNINFFAETYPSKINSATGKKEFIRSCIKNFSHIIDFIILFFNSFF